MMIYNWLRQLYWIWPWRAWMGHWSMSEFIVTTKPNGPAGLNHDYSRTAVATRCHFPPNVTHSQVINDFQYVSHIRNNVSMIFALMLKLVYDNGATLEQVRGLILASTQCSYFLHMRCVDIYGPKIYWQSYFGPADKWEQLAGTFCQQGQCFFGLFS